MKKEERIHTTPNGQPAAKYVSGDKPAADLPEGVLPDHQPQNDSSDGEGVKSRSCNKNTN